MRIAVKWDGVVITEDGRIGGHDAGATLVRRFLRIFPGAQVVGDQARRCDGFDVVPLSFLEPDRTVVLNMDVLDSPAIWSLMHQEHGGDPKIMNFVWRPLADLIYPQQSAATALSCALFPTFADSERTATEIKELVARQTTSQIGQGLKLDWVNLGFRVDHVQEREATQTPRILYPAIYLTPVKRPDLFMEIVTRVHTRTPVEVEMRLAESSLISEKAMAISRLPWVWVGPLTSTRSSYYQALARTTAFLGTASEGSYGLIYVEALGAGVIGVFPDEPWARALVPADYPFIYGNKATAEEMLYQVVKDPQAARVAMNRSAGEDFVDWVARNHSDRTFDREIQDAVAKWFAS